MSQRLALAATLLPVAFAAAAPAAHAAPVAIDLAYTCNFPLMDPQPLTLKITSDIPTTVKTSTETPEFPLSATAQVSAQAAKGLRALEAVSVEGTALASARLKRPDGATVPLKVPTTIAKTAIPPTGGFPTAATGVTPPLTFDEPGTATITIGDLVLTLAPTIANGTLTGLDRFETECFQNPGQNNLFASIQVQDDSADTQKPSTPQGLTAVPGPSSVALSWQPSTDNVAVTGYDVFQDGAQVASVTGTTTTISGLTPNTQYSFVVRARDAAGNLSDNSVATVVKTTGGETTAQNYALSGTAALKTLTKGNVALSGAVNASFVPTTGAFSADFVFNEANARLTTLGFLPVTAKLGFVPATKATGQLTNGVLKTQSKVRIKVQSVKLFGAIPIAGGNNCQTRSLSDINLTSAAGFTAAAGGTLSGTFAVSDLNGCGALNGLVSPLTAGGGNTLSLKLTPKTVA